MRILMAGAGAWLALSGCAGDGSGLDGNGRPVGEEATPLAPTLASIQQNVFTPVCTTCHAGASAPLGLRLDEGAAFAMLVNAPSAETPGVLRVRPGDPDASYLIQKLEGTAAIGARMPLNGPALPPATIAVIREWIAAGAPPSAIEDAPAVLSALWPDDGAAMAPSDAVLLASSTELDATLLDAGVVSLVRSGADGDFTDGDEVAVSPSLQLRTLEPTVLAIQASEGWREDVYELRISGGAPLGLADRAARLIDGDADNVAGGDFVLRFSVEDVR